MYRMIRTRTASATVVSGPGRVENGAAGRSLDHVHHDHDAQIEEDGHHACQHANDRKRRVAGADRGAEDVPLGNESGRGRKPAERQQQHRQQPGQHGLARPESGIVVQLIVRAVGRAHNGNHPERGHVGHGVDEQVEKECGLADTISRDERDQQVSGMGDARGTASRRFRLLCATPTTVPTIIVNAASSQRTGVQSAATD